MRKFCVWLSTIFLVFTSVIICSTTNITAKPTTQNRTQLKVALFPYIPDPKNDQNKAMLAKIELDFEDTNPSIDLVLRPLNQNDDFYSIPQLTEWLSSNYDIVEIDSLLLSDLVSSGTVRPWIKTDESDWHLAGKNSSLVGGKRYGIPHWLCGHFVFARDQRITESKSASELVRALRLSGTQSANLVGDLNGSWNLPSIYLDGWVDTHGYKELVSAISADLDPEAISFLKLIANECKNENGNPCLGGDYHDNKIAAQLFAEGKVKAYFGYSETLNYIFDHDTIGDDIYVASMPFGNGNRPILFSDVFVLSTKCSEEVQAAAVKFAAFMNQPTTFEWILLSRDAGSGAPRYLLPATQSAFNTVAIRQNYYYRLLQTAISDGDCYPNEKLPSLRKQMQKRIQELLK